MVQLTVAISTEVQPSRIDLLHQPHESRNTKSNRETGKTSGFTFNMTHRMCLLWQLPFPFNRATDSHWKIILTVNINKAANSTQARPPSCLTAGNCAQPRS